MDTNVPLEARAIATVLSHLRNARSYMLEAQTLAASTPHPQIVGTWCESVLLLVEQAHSVVRDIDAACRK